MTGLLEICVDSLHSARAAIAGGADRLELCSALSVGGLTPFPELLMQIRRESKIPIRCLMRPRPGDFLYTKEEIELMSMQIRTLNAAGASGFVIGCLTPDGKLDYQAMQPLIDAADSSPLTLHRCIDVSADFEETYRSAMDLGIDTVLTSGCAASCSAGTEVIGKLLSLRDTLSGPEILIGAGVNAQVIQSFRIRFPQSRAFHMSGKTAIPSGMTFRREGVPMGAAGFNEWEISQTSKDAVTAARLTLDA